MGRTLSKQTIMPVNGLDTSKPAEWITDQNSPNCQNVDDFQGQIRKRFGFPVIGAQMGGTNKEILAGSEFKRNNVTFVFRVGSDRAESLNTGSGAWSTISGSVLSSTEDDEVAICTPFLSGERIAVFTSATYVPQKWTGTGNHADLGGTPPKAKYCEAFGAYMILAHITDDGGSSHRTRVQWSDTGDPEEWDAATSNAGAVDLTAGGDITGIKTYGNYLTVHKRDRLHLGYFVSTDATIKFDEKYTPGTIAHHTIQNLPNGGQVYLGIDGIRIFNGSTSQLIDSPMNEDIRNSLNVAFAYRSWSVLVEDLNEYWIGIPTGGDENANVIYRFDYNSGKIYKNTFFENVRSAWNYSNINEMTWDDITTTWDETPWRWDDASGTAGYLVPMLSTNQGYSYNYSKSTTNDNALPVESIFDTKDYHIPNQLGSMIRWNRVEVWAKGNTVKVSYSTDGGNTWTQMDNLTLDSDYPDDDSPLMLYLDTVSTKLRLRFYNNEDEETFSMKQFVIYGTPREARGI